jgi:hypothetical protein
MSIGEQTESLQVCLDEAFVVADSHRSVRPCYRVVLRGTPFGNVTRP